MELYARDSQTRLWGYLLSASLDPSLILLWVCLVLLHLQALLPAGFLLGLFTEESVDDRQEEREVFTPLAPSTSWQYLVMDSHCSSTKGPPLGPGDCFLLCSLQT